MAWNSLFTLRQYIDNEILISDKNEKAAYLNMIYEQWQFRNASKVDNVIN